MFKSYLATVFDGRIETIMQTIALEINVVAVRNRVQERICGQIESVILKFQVKLMYCLHPV